MKLSDDVLNILKNFSQINNGIIINKGNVLYTSNPGGEKNIGILVRAELKDSFDTPNEAPIHDISQFLNTLKLFNDPNVEFKENHLVISDKEYLCSYMYANRNTIKISPHDKFDIGDDFVEFNLSWREISNVLQAANVLHCDVINIKVDNGKTVISTKDNTGVIKNDFSFSFDIEEKTKKADIDISISFMRLLQNDYRVRIPAKMNAVELSANGVTYWIAACRKQKYA